MESKKVIWRTTLALVVLICPMAVDARAANVTTAVVAVLSSPESGLNYANAKLAFDRIVDPSIDVDPHIPK